MATTTTTELVGVLASYASANLALSFINKAIARSPSVNYGILLLVQCLATVGYLACFGGRRPIRRAWAVAVFPSSALYAVQHSTRMRCFLLTSVDVVLVARQVVPIATFFLERIAGTERRAQNAKTVGCMVAIVLGVAIYTHGKGEGSDSLAGISSEATSAVLLHVAATAAANVYTKWIFVAHAMPSADYTLLVNLTSIPIFLCAAWRGVPGGVEGVRALGSLSLAKRVLCLSSVLVSIGISLAASHASRILAATSFAVFVNILKILTILADSAVDEATVVSPLSWLGIVVAFAFGFLYSALRAGRSREKEA